LASIAETGMTPLALNPQTLTPLAMAPLIVWAIYRRVRRNFGRQPIRTTRTWVRVGIFVVLTLLYAAASARHPHVAQGLTLGLLVGGALGLIGLARTRFEISGQDDNYTPDPWIGLGLTTLLLGRLIYRFMVVYPAMHAAAQAGSFAGYQRSPLTAVLFGLLFGYFIVYYAGVLVHHRRALEKMRAGTR
jgi:hypothetical protein